MQQRIKYSVPVLILLLACSYPAQADQLDGLKGLVPLYVSGISFLALAVSLPLVLSLPNSSHWFARTLLFIFGVIDITVGIMGITAMIDVAELIQPIWNILSFALAGGLTCLGTYGLYRVVRVRKM